MWKLAIQYAMPGLEPMTFGTWVSSHNPRPGLPPIWGQIFLKVIYQEGHLQKGRRQRTIWFQNTLSTGQERISNKTMSIQNFNFSNRFICKYVDWPWHAKADPISCQTPFVFPFLLLLLLLSLLSDRISVSIHSFVFCCSKCDQIWRYFTTLAQF